MIFCLAQVKVQIFSKSSAKLFVIIFFFYIKALLLISFSSSAVCPLFFFIYMNRSIIITIFNIPTGNYLFKVNNSNTRTKCEIYSKLTIKTPKRPHWCYSRIFIVNFELISHLVLLFLLLTLSR